MFRHFRRNEPENPLWDRLVFRPVTQRLGRLLCDSDSRVLKQLVVDAPGIVLNSFFLQSGLLKL